MSWGNVFRSSMGRAVPSKIDAARQEGYDQGFSEGVDSVKKSLDELEEPVQRIAVLSSAPLYQDMGALRQTELRGYIKGLANTVLAIEAMPSKTGRKQILAVIEGQLEAKRTELKESEAQEVRGD